MTTLEIIGYVGYIVGFICLCLTAFFLNRRLVDQRRLFNQVNRDAQNEIKKLREELEQVKSDLASRPGLSAAPTPPTTRPTDPT